MKILFTLTIFSLVCIAGAVQAGDSNLPLDKRVSIERLQLVEEYQTALQKCREHARKAAKNSCIEKRKDLLAKTLEELQNSPKTYFINKEGQYRDEKSLDQENMIRQGKSHE
jgi:hypothetical protein